MTTERVLEVLDEYSNVCDECFVNAKKLAFDCGVTERQLRKLVEEIRENDLAKGYVLISSDKGYKLSNDAEEIEAF